MKCKHCKSEYEGVCYTCFAAVDDLKYYKIHGKAKEDLKPNQKYTVVCEDGALRLKPYDYGGDTY
jgi:hypothetical protein